MNHYTPQARSLAARVIDELERKPRVLTSGDIAALFNVPSSAVNASLRACIEYGALQMRSTTNNSRSRSEYFLPGFEPPPVANVKRNPKTPPLQVIIYDDGDVSVRGHKVATDDEFVAMFTPKQLAYLVERVCTPVVEVAP